MEAGLTHSEFQALFKRFYVPLCMFADKYVSDKQLSADITQDIFFRLWQKRNDFNDLQHIKSFLYISVHNRALNEIAHRKTVKSNIDDLNNHYIKQFFQEGVIEEETYRIMLEEIDRLPNQMRSIMLLALKGLKNNEIANELNISIETVRSLKKIAYKKLRENLKEHYYLLLLLAFLFQETL